MKVLDVFDAMQANGGKYPAGMGNTITPAPATTERRHHAYSPSSLEMLEACPSFINRQSAKLHERTVAGTKAHAVADSRTDDATLSDEDAEAVADCLDLVETRRQALIALAIQAGDLAEAVCEYKENYWPIDDVPTDTEPCTTAGYADMVLVYGIWAEIIDYKFGKWAVTDAAVNLQGIAYALGVFRAFPGVEKVTVWFKQPHLDLTTSATFMRTEIPELYLRVQTVVARAVVARKSGDFSTATPKIPACNFCGNLGTCPKVAAVAINVGHKFHPIEIPDNITPTQLLNDRDTSLGMRLSQVVAVWAEAFRRQVTNRVLERKADIPAGFKLESRNERTVIDGVKLKQIALRYLTEEEYSTTLSTTFGGLEDLISEKAPRGSKKAALVEFKTALEDEKATERGQPYTFLKAVSTK